MRRLLETAMLRDGASETTQDKGTISVRYQIRVRGQLGQTMLQAFPGFEAHTGADSTLLVGSLADQAALHGALAQLEALGLELLELRQVPQS